MNETVKVIELTDDVSRILTFRSRGYNIRLHFEKKLREQINEILKEQDYERN